MKDVVIVPPEGYEVDKKNSTFEKIVFKSVKKALPFIYDNLGDISGWFVGTDSKVCKLCGGYNNGLNHNIFATKEQAEACIALAMLSQLKKAYNGDWEPNYKDDNEWKYSIEFYEDVPTIETYAEARTFLTFKTEELRDEFLANFKDLIEEAKPLL